MNLLDPPMRTNVPSIPESDQASLLDVLRIGWEGKWMILSITLLVVLAGGAYALLSTPVYEASSLIQIDEGKPFPGNQNTALGETAALVDIQSPASAEMHILRSRMVVGPVIDKLRLDVLAVPKYVPVLGSWLARHASTPSEPGFLGFTGYVHGNESLKLSRFEVPREVEGRRFTATLTDSGFALKDAEGRTVMHGRVGVPQEFALGSGRGHILVESMNGRPGAEFYVERRPKLQVLEEIQRALDIDEQGKQSGLIRARLVGPDPQDVALTLNEIGRSYVQQNNLRKSVEADKTLSLLANLLPELKAQVEVAENRLNQFRKRSGTLDLNSENRMVLERSIQLQSELSRLQQSREDLETTFGPQHPSVQGLQARIQGVSNELAGLHVRARTLPSVEQNMLSLSRDIKIKSDLYSSLLTSSQQLQLVKQGRGSNVRLIDEAVVPIKPNKPQVPAILAFSAALGLVAGVVLAFIRNGLRTGIKSPAEIEAQAGMHLVSTIPLAPAQVSLSKRRARRKGVRVLAARKPQDAAVESLRGMRTALQYAMRSSASSVVLITGPTPGVGKSFISANLAALLGASSRRVLLVDADLRKGQLNECFDLPRETGLNEVLTGEASFELAVHRDVLPNVDLLTTGSRSRSPAELLGSESTRSLLDYLAKQYELVILDAPAVLVATDAAVLAPLAGVVLLVAKADRTTVGELRESGQRLAHCGGHLRGVVFNGLSARALRYSGYAYGYAFAE